MLIRFTNYHFIGQGQNEGTAKDQNSKDYAWGLFQQRFLDDQRTSINYGYRFNHNQAEDSDYDHNGHRFLFGIKRMINAKTDLHLSNGFRLRDYRNAHSNEGIHRKDDQLHDLIAICSIDKHLILLYKRTLILKIL